MTKFVRSDITFTQNKDIKSILKEQNITIEQLSIRLNISRQRLSRILDNEELLTIAMLRRICSIIELKLEIIISK